MDVYLSTTSNRMNAVMKQLALGVGGGLGAALALVLWFERARFLD